ncbi:hypothetical protein Lal_00012366 [Lupinus albus]|nr:hypothetical protein Lal_00012366 [Lupinus albus]
MDIPCTRAVGIGTVCNTRDGMIHNAQIPSNHLRVSIDISIEDDALLPMLVDEDTITVERALGTLAWPVHLIDVVPIMVSADHSATSPPRIDEHASKNAKVVKSKQWPKSNLELSGEVAPKKTNFCAKLMKFVHKLPVDSTIMISIPLPIYGFSADEYIGRSDVKDIHDRDWIGASVIYNKGCLKLVGTIAFTSFNIIKSWREDVLIAPDWELKHGPNQARGKRQVFRHCINAHDQASRDNTFMEPTIVHA